MEVLDFVAFCARAGWVLLMLCPKHTHKHTRTHSSFNSGLRVQLLASAEGKRLPRAVLRQERCLLFRSAESERVLLGEQDRVRHAKTKKYIYIKHVVCCGSRNIFTWHACRLHNANKRKEKKSGPSLFLNVIATGTRAAKTRLMTVMRPATFPS